MKSQRLSAAAALLLLTVGVALFVVAVVEGLPRGLAVIVAALIAALIARDGVIRGGKARNVRLALALVLLVSAALVVLTGPALAEGLIAIVLVVASVVVARKALRVQAHWPRAPRPTHPVVIWNARSGGGKAVTHHVEAEATRRGIRPIELRKGDDLEQLVRDAVRAGADALAVAGGDGTQALVASIAAEHDLPFACIPAGTRNHFALDLGVDRDDVVGALDAFVDGTERPVDLAQVNGRVFVNNVSLGVYAEAVQREGYRDAKLRTILDTVPDVLSKDADTDRSRDLSWVDDEGEPDGGAAVVLVSNDVYRLGRAMGTGTRPSLDDGLLGVAVVGGRSGARAWNQWATTSFDVQADGPVPAGIDGEAVVLDPPLRFTTRPSALRVRIALHHPGASPSAVQPDTLRGTIRVLARMVAGHQPRVGTARD